VIAERRRSCISSSFDIDWLVCQNISNRLHARAQNILYAQSMKNGSGEEVDGASASALLAPEISTSSLLSSGKDLNGGKKSAGSEDDDGDTAGASAAPSTLRQQAAGNNNNKRKSAGGNKTKKRNSFSRVKSAMFGKKALFKETRAFATLDEKSSGDDVEELAVSVFSRESDTSAIKFRFEKSDGTHRGLKLSSRQVSRFSRISGLGNPESPEWISAFLDTLRLNAEGDINIKWADEDASDADVVVHLESDTVPVRKHAQKLDAKGPGKIAFTAALNAALGKNPRDAAQEKKGGEATTELLTPEFPELAKPIIPPGHRRKPTKNVVKSNYEELEQLDDRISSNRKASRAAFDPGERTCCILM